MKTIIYTLGFVASNNIELEEHSFDTESHFDLEILEDYFEETNFDPENYTEEDFEELCRYFVTENKHMEYAQHFINCLVLSRLELNTLTKILNKNK